MTGILSLKRWQRFEYQRDGSAISYEVKRLNALEAAPFRASMAKANGQIAALYDEIKRLQDVMPDDPVAPDGEPQDPGAQASAEERKAYESDYGAWLKLHPQYLSALRAHALTVHQMVSRTKELEASVSALIPADLIELAFSRYVRNVEGLEIDGERATEGGDLLAIADHQILMDVLGHVREMSEIGGAEGKASGSPSTFSPVERTSDSESVAPSIEGEASPAL